MFRHRNIQENDFEAISLFPQDEDELFHMFPCASYPLAALQLSECAAERHEPTVFLSNDQIAGYANIIKVEEGKSGTIGNIIIAPAFRRKGLGRYILDVMSQKLETIYSVNEVRLSCFSDNISGLILYQKYGFLPYDMEIRTNKKGDNIILIHLWKNI